MVKKIAFLLLAVLVTVTSCNKPNEEGGGKSKDVTFTATLPSISGGPQITWAAGDEIVLFADAEKYLLKADATGASSTFKGTVASATNYYAATPAAAFASQASGSISGTVPANQKAVLSGVDPKVPIAVAASSSTELKFTAVVSLLKVSLGSSNNIKSITVASRGNDYLAGDVSFNATTAKASVTNGASSVVLASDGILAKGDYYIAVIPATYVDGLTITVADEFGRVFTTNSEEFISAKIGATLDLGQADKNAKFETPTIDSTPFDLGFNGNGETLKAEVAKSFTSSEVISKPDWATVSVSGTSINVTAAANADKNARYGKVIIEGVTTSGPARVAIPVCQAAAGMKIAYDSFTSPKLDPNWKGNMSRSNLQYGNGYVSMIGTGDYNTSNPIFWYGDKVRLKYSGEDCNQWICTIDCASGSGGLWMFNQHGYDGETYDFKSTQSYTCFMPYAAGETTGGFYCFNAASANAMDNWSSIHGDITTEWLRLEITNIDRADERAADEQLAHEIHGSWAAAHIYTLAEDENCVLTKGKLLFTKELWWWNDNPTLGYEYGYFGVFVKDEAETKIRNFTLCYTDK